MLLASKDMGVRHNVSFRVIDLATNKVVSTHTGHNQATNTLLTGIASFLKGDGVLNQGTHMLNKYVPKYISLGTMGLINQEEDADGLPAGIGEIDGEESQRFDDYMNQVPGFGADGYDANQNNNRTYLGIGPAFADRDTAQDESPKTIRCELVSPTFPRAEISYRTVIPEIKAELPETIDVIFSAMISTGALAQFREPGKDYVFITEAGLWSKRDLLSMNPESPSGYSKNNGLLAGYRIAPPDEINWDMVANNTVTEEQAQKNRNILKHEILKVGINQVVQVVWKIQIGAIKQLTASSDQITSITNQEIDDCFDEYLNGTPCKHQF